MYHDTREDKQIGYEGVITDPDDVLRSEMNGQTWVLDGGKWYNCHPAPTWSCPIKNRFPGGGYGVRWRVMGKIEDELHSCRDRSR